MSPLSPAGLEAYLHEHIPLSKAMEVRVVSAGPEGVTLAAPLEPNLNHRGTAFGGSVSTLGILAAWAFLHTILRDRENPCRIVIQKNETNYLHPIASSFEAACPAPPPAIVDRFLNALGRKGRARITLHAAISCRGAEAAAFAGDYVAMQME